MHQCATRRIPAHSFLALMLSLLCLPWLAARGAEAGVTFFVSPCGNNANTGKAMPELRIISNELWKVVRHRAAREKQQNPNTGRQLSRPELRQIVIDRFNGLHDVGGHAFYACGKRPAQREHA